MKIRRAATLVCTFEGSKPVVHNFLKKEMFECNAPALEILAVLDEWSEMEDALARLPEPEAAVPMLRELIKRDLVVFEGSPQAERDEHYRKSWRWGVVGGFYHFSQRDLEYLDTETAHARLTAQGGAESSPPLLVSNDGLEHVVELPAFDLADPFRAALYQRRTQREFSGRPISLEALSDCLFAGNGIKGALESGPYGRLPHAMTPSGGARNPFELFVDARNVAGLAPGIWHYAAAEHSLGFLHDEPRTKPSVLTADQEWTNDCAALVYLVATFERSAWKYRQASAYRVVLMEIGAIVQNIQLMAARTGIAAAPTGAIRESEIEISLRIREIEQGVMFVIVLGDPL